MLFSVIIVLLLTTKHARLSLAFNKCFISLAFCLFLCFFIFTLLRLKLSVFIMIFTGSPVVKFALSRAYCLAGFVWVEVFASTCCNPVCILGTSWKNKCEAVVLDLPDRGSYYMLPPFG